MIKNKMDIRIPKNKSKIDFKKFFLVIFIIGLFGAFYNLGVLVGKKELSFQGIRPVLINKKTPLGLDFSLFWRVWNLIEEKYPQDVDYQKMLYGAIDGLIKSLGDPYSIYLTEKEAQSFLEDMEGDFGGIGAEIGIKDKKLKIISTLEGTPAQKARLLAGDIILRINGEDTEEMNLAEAVMKIRGDSGTKVKLLILREGWKEGKEFIITREIIRIKSVKYELKENFAYIKINQFSEKTNSEFKESVNFFKDKKISGIILDLRDNPGGYLDSAIDIASYFLEKKVVLIEQLKGGKEKVYTTKGRAVFKDEPLVVLINEGSASASEIVAGAIKDNNRGILIGEKTFGKGSVQSLEKIDNGFLKLTIAFWLTPSRHFLNEKGLSPNIEVKMSEEDIKNNNDKQLKRALEYLKD